MGFNFFRRLGDRLSFSATPTLNAFCFSYPPPIATGYDPLDDDEPELARSMAASVQQCIAFGQRAGQKVRRIGSGFGYDQIPADEASPSQKRPI